MTEFNIPRCRELIAELRDLPNDYIAYAEELCPEVADQLEAALAKIERLHVAVTRLGSMEAFAYARAIRSHDDKELLARIDYAQTVLSQSGGE